MPSDIIRDGNTGTGGSAVIADTYANRPAASGALNGQQFYATDKLMEWLCVGGAWTLTNVYPPEVSSLPSSPIDQQECIYVADATNGIKWHLRYRSASASSYKWEFIGGPPLYAVVDTDQSTVSASYGDITTAGPTVTAPLAGDFRLNFSAESYNASVNTTNYVSPNGVTNDESLSAQVGTASANFQIVRTILKTGVTASTAFKLQYKTSGGTAHFLKRRIEAWPVRVG